jgi:hypothetical protein
MPNLEMNDTIIIQIWKFICKLIRVYKYVLRPQINLYHIYEIEIWSLYLIIKPATLARYLQQVGGFLRFPPPIKLTATI